MFFFLSDIARVKIQYWFDCEQIDDYVFDRTNINRRQIQRMRFNWNIYDEIVQSNLVDVDRSMILQSQYQNALLTFLKNKSIVYLNEMIWFLFDEYDIVCFEIIVWRNLHRLKWNKKRSYKVTKKRNQRFRDDWALRLIEWNVEQFVFIDESTSDERIDDRKFAWDSISISTYSIQYFKRNKRWNILFVYTIDDYIIWKIHHENIIAQIFCDFIRYQILFFCFIDDFEFRNVLIMNNARIHHNAKLKLMCKDVNVTLTFLFFYSLDYNFIEISFAILKIWIRKNVHLTKIYIENIDEFDRFLKNAMKTIQKKSFSKKNEKENSKNLFRLANIQYS